MPAVSFYVSEDVLASVKAKAKEVNASVSRIVREAVENYIQKDEQKEAKERVLKILSEKKPLGDRHSWEEIHQERSLADVDRG